MSAFAKQNWGLVDSTQKEFENRDSNLKTH